MSSNYLTAVMFDLNAIHKEIVAAETTAKQKAADAGDVLTGLKAELAHGEFKPWIEQNCEFSYRTASAYMRVAKLKDADRCTFDRCASIAEVLDVMRQPRPAANSDEEPEAITTARRRAEIVKKIDGMSHEELEGFMPLILEVLGDVPHPINDALPKITAEDYANLIEQIHKRGQLLPIVRWEGLILDGMNRLNACKELGIEPVFEDWPEDADMDLVSCYCLTMNGLLEVDTRTRYENGPTPEYVSWAYLSRDRRGAPDATLWDCWVWAYVQWKADRSRDGA
jgi:hypothetical protein